MLSGLANGTDLHEVAPRVAALASERNLFSGDGLIDLAAVICTRVAGRHKIAL